MKCFLKWAFSASYWYSDVCLFRNLWQYVGAQKELKYGQQKGWKDWMCTHSHYDNPTGSSFSLKYLMNIQNSPIQTTTTYLEESCTEKCQCGSLFYKLFSMWTTPRAQKVILCNNSEQIRKTPWKAYVMQQRHFYFGKTRVLCHSLEIPDNPKIRTNIFYPHVIEKMTRSFQIDF